MSSSNVTPFRRRRGADDPYSSWFDAEQRSGEALRAGREALSKDRAWAYATYVRQVDLEGMVAAALEHVHASRIPA